MDILIAFSIMLAVAVVVGILLLLCSYFFAVEEDPKKQQLRECLPGINCGACGFSGCDGYAEALSEGNAKPNLCIPGAQTVADAIGGILGVEVEPFKDVVAFVACNGHCDATFKTAEYNGINSCAAASMMYGGTNSCLYGCLGLGDCAKACPSGAICLDSGIARVDTSRCLGCGMCKSVCPKSIISMLSQYTKTAVMCSNTQKGADARKACKNACIGCKKCEKTCQSGAIKVKDNLAVIDYSECTNCGECVAQCPTACLKEVFFPQLSEEVVV